MAIVANLLVLLLAVLDILALNPEIFHVHTMSER